MESKQYQEEVDKRCSAVNDEVLKLGPELHGLALRNKIFELAGYMSRFNELSDKAGFKFGLQKNNVKLAESLSMQAINSDEKLGKMPATLKSYYVETTKIELDGAETTLNNEKNKLECYSYAYTRFTSIFELLQKTIMAAQSGLSFDKEELRNLNYS
jgi:hypothetical protein